MTLRANLLISTAVVAAVASALAGCAGDPLRVREVTVTAVADVVPSPPGCGYLFIGTPITFRVLSGPPSLEGKRIDAVVACLDFYKHFYLAGRTYRIELTRKNVYEIEGDWPSQFEEPLAFYLRTATDLSTGKTSQFK